ncbi:MAG: hypothetical protein ACHQF0_02790 [Chitinophagales bacterium]
MKKIKILQAVIFLAFVVLLAGCAPGRVYSYYPARSSASFSLILDPGPGVYTTRYYDGRYYYRSPEGYTYWRGYDNRYYLDRSYLNRGHYDKREYNEWHRNYNNHGRHHY